ARAGQSFHSLRELGVALRSAHLASSNIRAAELERQKAELLTQLSESARIQSLFAPPSGSDGSAPHSPPVSHAGLRELLQLTGSASAVLALLHALCDAGVKVSSFQELMLRLKKQILNNYQ